MISIFLIFLYVLCAFGVGYLGRNTRAGFVGVTLLSVLFTPLIIFVVILLLRAPGDDMAAPRQGG